MRPQRLKTLLLAGAILLASAYGTPALAITFQALCQDAFELAKKPFAAVNPEPVPAFDPPEGNTDLGLDYHEYLALLTKRPFIDDGNWWLKQRPRGNVEKEPLWIGFVDRRGRRVQPLPFNAEDFVYATQHISPQLPLPLPEAARYITAVAVGHRQFDRKRWPQVFHLGGNGYARLAGYDNEFSTSVRFGTHHATTDHEVFPRVEKLFIGRHDRDQLEMFAVINSQAFTFAAHMHLTPGSRSTLRVKSVLFPRAGVSVSAETGTGPLAFSSMFWKGATDTSADRHDQAHDADVFEHCSVSGRRVRLGITIPDRNALPLRTEFGQAPCFAFLQTDRDAAHYAAYNSAQYERRASIRVHDISSSVPYAVRLVRYFTDYEGHDNIVAYVAFTQPLPQAPSARDGQLFSYSITATSAP